MTEEQEKKNKRIAMFTSLGVHGAILLLLLFMVAWRAPNPPVPEFGIELNFGMDEQGRGEVQPQTPVGTAQNVPEEEVNEEEETPVPEQPIEVTEEEIVEDVKPVEAEPVQPEVVSKIESPVVVEEKKEVKPVEKPKEKPAEKVAETRPEVKPEREIPKAVYKPKTETSTDATAKEKQGTPASQGDDANKIGDKGDEKGALDAKALYGKQGGGGGGVSMSGFGGFEWPTVETPALPDESYGVYEFTVKVDEQGYVISVIPLQRGLSFEAERRLKAAIQKLQFVPKGKPAPSEGRITFKVVSARD
jgi:protein TonB